MAYFPCRPAAACWIDWCLHTRHSSALAGAIVVVNTSFTRRNMSELPVSDTAGLADSASPENAVLPDESALPSSDLGLALLDVPVPENDSDTPSGAADDSDSPSGDAENASGDAEMPDDLFDDSDNDSRNPDPADFALEEPESLEIPSNDPAMPPPGSLVDAHPDDDDLLPDLPLNDDNDDVYKASSDIDMDDDEDRQPATSSTADVKDEPTDTPLTEQTAPETLDAPAVEASDVSGIPGPSTESDVKPEPQPVAAAEEDTKIDPNDLVEEPQNLETEDPPVPKSRDHVRQTHAIIIPSYASWFNMKKIHQIEKESLPEFFSTSHPSKSPKIYANYRNFMINSYRLNPNEYLTLTSCRRNLVGDVGTLMRVHRFLNKWGLVNYQVNPQFKPAYSLEKLPNGSLVGLPYTGDFHVQYDTPRGLFPFDTFKVSPDRIDIPKLKQLLNLGDAKQESASHGPSVNGTSENGTPVSKKQKIVDSKDGWTAKELSSLLIGVRDHKNDWYKISKIVGTRSANECILKFLKLPIEDDFNTLSEKEIGILKYAPNFPVSAVDNPAISNLAFMTQLVDSDVAKAASERASKVMDEKILDKIKQVYGDEIPTEPASKKVKDERSDGKESGNGDESTSEATRDVDINSDKDTDAMDVDSASEEVKQNGSINNTKRTLESEITEEFKSEMTPAEALKEASSATFGTVGARSHLFANYEEREMHRLTNSIVNQELNKINIKLHKVSELEKVYERERKRLAQQQEEIFVDRLALAKSTISITKKLSEALALMQGSSTESADVGKASTLLSDVQSLLYKPNRHSLVETNNDESAASATSTNEQSTSTANGLGEYPNNVKPLSLEAPQQFKVWAP